LINPKTLVNRKNGLIFTTLKKQKGESQQKREGNWDLRLGSGKFGPQYPLHQFVVFQFA